MKRTILIAALLVLSLALCVFADSAVQQDQNAGFLSFTTATVAILATQPTYIYTSAPASSTTWAAGNPGAQYIVLPARTRSFTINVFDNDLIAGDKTNFATGTYYVGKKIASGSSYTWASLDPDQRTLNIRLQPNAATASKITLWATGQ